MIRVLVAGAAGKMGDETCRAILNEKDMVLAAAVDSYKESLGKPAGGSGTAIVDDIEVALADCDVMVDFTHPDSVRGNLKAAIKAGAHCVIGTTGFSQSDLADIASEINGSKTNVLIAPNFAIGAVLMMRMAKMAAAHMDDCEIIELHHDKKADAPSGTAAKTAALIGSNSHAERLKPGEKETAEGARGAYVNGIHIHSVRLPGLVAHQEVIFGGQGQTLSIRHDSMDRTSFMPGVIIAVRAIGNHPGLTYGLENFLNI